MLLVCICGRCHLHLRINVFVLWIASLIWRLLKIKSYNNIQTSRILFSYMSKKPWGSPQKILEISLTGLLCPFIFVHKLNAQVLFKVRVCFTSTPLLLTKSNRPRLPKYFPDSWLLSVISCNHFAWNFVSVILFFRHFILCKRSCQSSSQYSLRLSLCFCAANPSLNHM